MTTTFRSAFPAVAEYADQLPYDRELTARRFTEIDARLSKEHTLTSALEAVDVMYDRPKGPKWTKADAVKFLAVAEFEASETGRAVEARKEAAEAEVRSFAEFLYAYSQAAYFVRSAMHQLASSVELAAADVKAGRAIHSTYTMAGDAARLAEMNGRMTALEDQLGTTRGVQALVEMAREVRTGARPSGYFGLRNALEVLAAEDAATNLREVNA